MNNGNCIYNKDVNNMLSTIDKHIPKLDNWYLNQSIVFEDDKRIVFKSITKDDKNVGNRVSVIFNNEDKIDFIRLNNCITLSKRYIKDNSSVCEYMSVLVCDDVAYRNVVYSVDNEEYSYCEKYLGNTGVVFCNDFGISDTYNLSLEEILMEFKSRENGFSRKR